MFPTQVELIVMRQLQIVSASSAESSGDEHEDSTIWYNDPDSESNCSDHASVKTERLRKDAFLRSKRRSTQTMHVQEDKWKQVGPDVWRKLVWTTLLNRIESVGKHRYGTN